MTNAVTLASLANSGYLRNRIINGAMMIDQRNAGAAVTTDGAYPVDRFVVSLGNDGAVSIQQDTTAPVGFKNSVKWTVTTADTSIGANQYTQMRQAIEGLNLADLNWGSSNAKSITLSFWTRSSLTGTLSGSIRNSDGTRSYVFAYTISSVNTWEYKTITIPGDTTGTWLTTNGVGMFVSFDLGSGSTFQSAAGSWTAGNYWSAPGSVPVIGTLNATWFITGLQLEVGTQATPFEWRPFGAELVLCQRYYEKSYDYATVPGTAGNYNGIDWNYAFLGSGTMQHIGVTLNFKQLKRALPTMTYYSPASGNSGVFQDVSGDRTANQYQLGQRAANVYVVTNDTNAQIRAHWVASAEL